MNLFYYLKVNIVLLLTKLNGIMNDIMLTVNILYCYLTGKGKTDKIHQLHNNIFKAITQCTMFFRISNIYGLN